MTFRDAFRIRGFVIAALLWQQLQGPPQVTPLNSVPANPTIEWSHESESLQRSQGFLYRYHLDGAAKGAALSGVQCTGTVSPWTCNAPLPVTIGGEHTVYLTVTDVVDGVEYTSPPSPTTTFTIELIGAPSSPVSVLIVK